MQDDDNGLAFLSWTRPKPVRIPEPPGASGGAASLS
jgi:hypothetical protein